MWPFNGGGSGPPPLVNTLLQALQPLVVVAVVIINVVNTAVQQQTGGQGALAQFFQNATNFANNLIAPTGDSNQGGTNWDKYVDLTGSDHESDIEDIIDGLYNPEQLPDIEDSPDFQWNFDFELEDDDSDDWLPDIGSPPPGTTWLTFEEDWNWGSRFEVEIDLDERYTFALTNLVEAAPSELQLSLNGLFGEQISVLPPTFGQLIETEIGVNVQVTEEQYITLEQNYGALIGIQEEINATTDSASANRTPGGRGTGGDDPNMWLAALLAAAAALAVQSVTRAFDLARQLMEDLRQRANESIEDLPWDVSTPLGEADLGETVTDPNHDEIWNWDQGGFTLLPEERGSNIVEAQLPQDAAVNPIPPGARPVEEQAIGSSRNQRAELLNDVETVRGLDGVDVRDIRVNQQQTNADGQRTGVNRPDLQITLTIESEDGTRYVQRIYIEYERPGNPRGEAHAQRILENDRNAIVIVKVVPEGDNFIVGNTSETYVYGSAERQEQFADIIDELGGN